MAGETVASPVQMRPVWPENYGDSAQVVNQFVISNDVVNNQGSYLLFGHFSPPVFTDEEHARVRLEQSAGAIAISPRGSFYMTKEAVRQLRDMLTKHLEGEDDLDEVDALDDEAGDS